jgi:hypothetical protein
MRKYKFIKWSLSENILKKENKHKYFYLSMYALIALAADKNPKSGNTKTAPSESRGSLAMRKRIVCPRFAIKNHTWRSFMVWPRVCDMLDAWDEQRDEPRAQCTRKLWVSEIGRRFGEERCRPRNEAHAAAISEEDRPPINNRW